MPKIWKTVLLALPLVFYMPYYYGISLNYSTHRV